MPIAAGREHFSAFLLALDQPPWGQLWRVFLGYMIVPMWLSWLGSENSTWTLLPFFLATLLAVRVIPAAIRKLLPFDVEVQAAWSDRRRVAKRFDSYQWQKLFWIALGLAVYLSVSKAFAAAVTLTIVAAAAGGSGLMLWGLRRRSS